MTPQTLLDHLDQGRLWPVPLSAQAGFDLAAAFGPVRGLAGKIVFTDLINLTTAPDQTVTIAAINPGVKVTTYEARLTSENAARVLSQEAQ